MGLLGIFRFGNIFNCPRFKSGIGSQEILTKCIILSNKRKKITQKPVPVGYLFSHTILTQKGLYKLKIPHSFSWRCIQLH